MLQPKKMKHRKWHKGRSRNRMKETRGVRLSFGRIGLQALEPHWITARQIEAARKAITNNLEREGKLWIRIFPDKPVTRFPPEVTMGGGKGDLDHYVAVVRPGRILFELDGVGRAKALRAFALASHKLPIKTKVVLAD